MKIIPHLMATLLLASSSTVYASEHHEKEEKKQHAQHESGSPDDHQDGHEEEHEESHDEEQHDKDNHGAHKEEDRAAENGHEDHGKSEEPELTFSAELLREFGGEIASAQAGVIHQQVSLPGEVRLNEEAVAHITPFAVRGTSFLSARQKSPRYGPILVTILRLEKPLRRQKAQKHWCVFR